MKTIIYDNRKYYLPKQKISFIATDPDGCVMGFTSKPLYDDDWCCLDGEMYVLSPVKEASESLVELK